MEARFMDQRFAGKVVVVTGGAGGIGRAAAVRFASEGANVVAVDLPDSALDETVAAVKQAGGTCLAVAADVSRAADVEGYAREAVRAFDGVDCLLNNAGIIGHVGPLADYPEEAFDRVIAVNLKGIWLGMRTVIPLLRARGGGAIVNTASGLGLRAAPLQNAYGASKHGVIGLTKTAAVELAPEGIRVNAICPSPIDTPMMHATERARDPDDPSAARREAESRIPMGRYGLPEEVAALAAFLCSPDAAFITGGIYTIDGGNSAR